MRNDKLLFMADMKMLEKKLNNFDKINKNADMGPLDKDRRLENIMVSFKKLNCLFNENEVDIYINALKKAGATNVKAELANLKSSQFKYRIIIEGDIDFKQFFRYAIN